MSKFSYKSLFIIFFFLLIGVVVLSRFLLPKQKVSAAWWNDGWKYRKAISVANTSGSNLTDFQVSLSVGTSALVAAGKMKSDCSDIRITDQNNNLIPFWIEENNPGCNQITDTKIWVKATSLPTSGAIIYFYYGNSSANSIQDGKNVFLEFDDFNNPNTISNWIHESNSSSTFSISGGTLSIVTSAADYNSVVFGGNYNNVIVNSRFSFTSQQSHGGFLFRAQTNASENSYQWIIREGNNDNRFQKRLSGSQTYPMGSTNYALPSTLTANGWYPAEFRISGTTINTYFNNQQTINGDINDSDFSSGKIGFLSYDGNEYFDYIFVRKYASADPTPTLQAEEIGTAPIAYWKFDEGIGTTAYNSITGKKNGGLIGTTLPEWKDDSECVSGKCLYFNGVDNAISVGLGTDYFPLNTFSICTWIKTSGVAPGMSTPGIFGFTYGLRLNLTNSGEFITRMDSGTDGPSLTASGNLFDNKFHYLCLTYDGTNRHMYVDGVKKISAATTWLGTTRWATNGVNIGRDNNDVTYFFKGYIDEPKIYPYARTAAQIKLDYNSRGSKKGSSANLGVKSNTAPTLNSKLVAYYKFDEGVGTTAYDSSLKKTNGVLQTGTSIPVWSNNGKFNKALNFTATNNSRIRAPITSTNGLNIKGAITYSAWFKRTTNTGYQTLIDMLDSCISTGDGYYLRFETGGILRFYSVIDNAVGSSPFTLSYTNSILTDTSNWHHVIATWDGTTNSNGAKMYIDGKLVSQTTAGVDATLMASLVNANLTIGSLNCNAHSFDGLIDEVKVYNAALTADEIKQDYNQGSATQFGATNQTIGGTTTSLEYCIPGDTSYCVPPIAEWNFEENVGTSITYDTSGNGNNFGFNTGTSAPTWTSGRKNIGSALQFDGTSDWLLRNLSPSIAANTDYSQCLWFYPTSSAARQVMIDDNNQWEHWIALQTDKKIVGCYYNLSQTCVTSATAINLNTWNHVCLSVQSGQKMSLYLNGLLTNTNSNIATTLPKIFDDICVGANGGAHAEKFSGKIDNVRVYNYARTPAQVAYDYNKGGPIGWWKLDECQGLTAFDSSGLGNTGAISIGPSGTQNTAGTCQVGTSAAWTAGASGKINSSLNFDGNDDYMTAPISVGGSEATIAFWVKNPAAGAGAYLFRSDANVRTYITVSGNNISFSKGNPNVGLGWASIITSNWNHVVLKWWTSSGTTYGQAYINGQAIGIGTSFTDNRQGSYITLAGFNTTGTQNTSGQFDDVRVYNYALTSEQVKVLYNGGAVSFN